MSIDVTLLKIFYNKIIRMFAKTAYHPRGETGLCVGRGTN